jgi:5-bromo-4-chloroindolyl phosphate hydrolysis protein
MITKHKRLKYLLIAIPFALLISTAYHQISVWITLPYKGMLSCMDYFFKTGERRDGCPPIIHLSAKQGKIKGNISIVAWTKGYPEIQVRGTWEYLALTKDVYEKVKKSNPLPREVDEFLASRIVSDLEMKEWTCVLWPKKEIDRSLANIYILIEDEGCPPLIVIKSTLRSTADADRVKILSKAEGAEKIKLSSDSSFAISKRIYEEIKSTIKLSREVEEFLASVVDDKKIIEKFCSREIVSMQNDEISWSFYPLKDSSVPYKIIKNTSCPPVVGFTDFARSVKGYAWILPQPEGSVPFAWEGSSDFAVSKKVYKEIKAAVPLSKEADAFLASRIERAWR